MNTIIDGTWAERASEIMPDLPSREPGVYETLLLRSGEPVFWEEHLERLEAGARAFGLAPLPLSEGQLRRHVQELARSSRIDLGVARYAVWRQDGAVHWRVEVSPPRPHMRKREFRVVWGPVVPGRMKNSEFKHFARTAWQEALRAARQSGFEETLLCDESGQLVEGGGANVFLVREGALVTPHLDSGALPGVMRGQVLGLATALGWTTRERRVTRDDVASADELWVSNSIIGIRKIVAVGEDALSRSPGRFEAFCEAWRSRHGWHPVVVAA